MLGAGTKGNWVPERHILRAGSSKRTVLTVVGRPQKPGVSDTLKQLAGLKLGPGLPSLTTYLEATLSSTESQRWPLGECVGGGGVWHSQTTCQAPAWDSPAAQRTLRAPDGRGYWTCAQECSVDTRGLTGDTSTLHRHRGDGQGGVWGARRLTQSSRQARPPHRGIDHQKAESEAVRPDPMFWPRRNCPPEQTRSGQWGVLFVCAFCFAFFAGRGGEAAWQP